MAFEESKESLMSGDASSYHDDTDWEQSVNVRAIRQKENRWRRALLYAFIALPWVLLAALSVWTKSSLEQYKASLEQCMAKYYLRPDLTYSPVQHLVEYETKIFTTGKPSDPTFSPWAGEPSDETDKAWTSLYPSLHQLVPYEDAVKLPNRTTLYPHDDQHRYVIELDVFHQLHCLNMVRKATRPDYYKPHMDHGEAEDPFTGPEHITHCIDAIRQSLMCASDITVYTFTWDEEGGHYQNHAKTPHTCRNFDVIQDWARVNTNQVYFDWRHRVLNDPLDPGSWTDGYTGQVDSRAS